MSPEAIRNLAVQINTGASAAESYRKLGMPSRSAAISRAHACGFAFGQAVTPEMLERALAPKPQPVRQPSNPRAPMDTDSPIRALAAECLTEHRIVQNALPPLVDRVMADDELREVAIRELVTAHCERHLNSEMQARYNAERRKTGGGPLAEKRTGAVALAAHAQAVAASLMDDFKLPNGKKLGDATRYDLDAALAVYRIQSDDAAIKHRWMRLVQQCLSGSQTVRERLTDERLAELREEARKVEA
jgi:hypothetical protein